MASYSEKQKKAVWDKADKIRGKDPDKYRKDPYGNVLFYNSYGKYSPMGWVIDHIKPKGHGGSRATRNLQALKSSVNQAKSDSLTKRSRHSKR